MKRISYFVLIGILVLSLAGCSNDKEQNTTNTNNTTSINRVSTQINTVENTTNTSVENTTTNEITLGNHEATQPETDLASYHTKLSGKDSPRSQNIGITANALNGTLVEAGKTFSFGGTIGVCTAEKGYKEADTFDHDGKKIQTLGGGNCQVSSTLYNAVLQVPELAVVERHAHSNKVTYVPKDKDAAVAYGSVDFKFKNNTGYPVKIYASADLKGVTIRLVRC